MTMEIDYRKLSLDNLCHLANKGDKDALQVYYKRLGLDSNGRELGWMDPRLVRFY